MLFYCFLCLRVLCEQIAGSFLMLFNIISYRIQICNSLISCLFLGIDFSEQLRRFHICNARVTGSLGPAQL